MGSKAGAETVAGIIAAFWAERTWSQATLARRLGLSVRALRRHLDELQRQQWPLERDEDHPHVYWSVPKDWFPGGVMFGPQELAAVIQLLLRVSDGAERARVLQTIAKHAPKLVTDEMERVLPPNSSETEEALLPTLLDAVAHAAPLHLRYFTASKGTMSERVVSVQRVLPGPPSRFIGYCHTANDLRWFRLDYVAGLRPAPKTTFVESNDEDVAALLQTSVDGYAGLAPTRVAFFVRFPEARWVAKNLPEGLDGTDVDGGFLVDCETRGLLPAARFVVGLGSAAECRSESLTEAVRELAEGALRASDKRRAGEQD